MASWSSKASSEKLLGKFSVDIFFKYSETQLSCAGVQSDGGGALTTSFETWCCFFCCCCCGCCVCLSLWTSLQLVNISSSHTEFNNKKFEVSKVNLFFTLSSGQC